MRVNGDADPPQPDGCECHLGSQSVTWTGEYVLVSPGMLSTGVDPSTPVLIAYHAETNTWIPVDEVSPLAGEETASLSVTDS